MNFNVDNKALDSVFENSIKVGCSESDTLTNLVGIEGPNRLPFTKKYSLEYQLPELTVKKIRDVKFGSFSGLMYKSSNLIYSESQFPNDVVNRFREKDSNPAKTTRHFAAGIVFFRPGDHIYGHWLVDILPRVWLALQLGLDEDYKFIFRSNIPKYAITLLGIIGLKRDSIELVENNCEVTCSNSFFIPNLRYNQYFHSLMEAFTLFLGQRLKYSSKTSILDKTHPSKVFLSRKNWNISKNKTFRFLTNQLEVENFFEEEGFTIVYPEALEFSEQYHLFNNAEILAGEDGSALHNSIFLRKHKGVICLRNEMNHSLIQGSLCNLKQQPIRFIMGKTNEGSIMDRSSPYSIDIDELKKVIRCT